MYMAIDYNGIDDDCIIIMAMYKKVLSYCIVLIPSVHVRYYYTFFELLIEIYSARMKIN